MTYTQSVLLPRANRLRDELDVSVAKIYRNLPACDVTFNQHAELYFEAVLRLRRETFKMAKKKALEFHWEGYVNVDIPADQKNEARAYMNDLQSVSEAVSELISDGYKVKLESDKNSDGFKCVLVCHASDSVNFGFAMSGFASNWFDALAVCMYKHFVLCSEDWGEAGNIQGSDFG